MTSLNVLPVDQPVHSLPTRESDVSPFAAYKLFSPVTDRIISGVVYGGSALVSIVMLRQAARLLTR